jgi:cupin 2 domain-containing protein
MKSGQFLTDLPRVLPDEVVDTLIDARAVRIERIVSRGQHSPPGFWYDQEEHEWVLLLTGAARLRFAEGDRLIEMLPGSHVLIGAHEKHRVEWTSPDEDSVWLAVFYRDEP